MKTKSLTATQIDTLAQRLSETSIEPATSAKKAGDNFAPFWPPGSAPSARPSPSPRS